MNKNTLTNHDLLSILHHDDIAINGIVSKDNVLKPLKQGFTIINLDNDKGPGTHWTVIYCINEGFSLYYDSYGFPAPECIEDLLHRYEYNKKQIQAIDSTSCGFYCVAFIKFMHGKRAVEKAFNCFLNLFGKNTLDNEIVLHGILYG
jgi:hypothetical protein